MLEKLRSLLVGKEVSFLELDNIMIQEGFYSVLCDGVTQEMREYQNICFTNTKTEGAEIVIHFEIISDFGQGEYSLIVKSIDSLQENNTKVDKLKSYLVGKELEFIELDVYMERQGFYSVYEASVVYDIKKDKKVIYTSKETNEAEIVIYFDITVDCGKDEIESVFDMKIKSIESL